MSSSDFAIRVEGISKAYTIRHQQTDHVTLAELALERARHPFRRSEREQFLALDDVNFEVHQGEILGLVGRNGAGKSTLLKVLSRITEPTAGRIELWGRVGSLLEVGTGFHPELTGRENIYLNGSILGMTRKEIQRRFDEIVEFSGVELFLDTPVKRYSSGMYVRLAFAVAAHLETEILLVDEVLAVGDQEFQRKTLGTMSAAARSGRTIVFVSHNLSAVTQLCDRVLYLKGGTTQFLGPTAETIERYMEQQDGDDRSPGSHDLMGLPRPDGLPQSVSLERAELVDDHLGTVPFDSDLLLRVTVRCQTTVDRINFSITARRDGLALVGTSFGTEMEGLQAGQSAVYELRLSDHGLTPGRYLLDLAVCQGTPQSGRLVYDKVHEVVPFSVAPFDGQGRAAGDWAAWFGPIRLPGLKQDLLDRSMAHETSQA